MKLITFSSFKGGAGKTTALMGLCCAMAAKRRKVALFEADPNRPLTVWKANSAALYCWDAQCEVFVADDMAQLEVAYAKAESMGFDYAFADTAGGSSELNNTLVASADFLLLPSMLTPLDVDETLATYRYVIELLMAEKLETPTAILKQRVPVGRKTNSQVQSEQLLNQLPVFATPMHDRDVFAAMKTRGMLHLMIGYMLEAQSMRLQIRNYMTALEELVVLSDFIENSIGTNHADS